jgi:hypothetical protein
MSAELKYVVIVCTAEHYAIRIGLSLKPVGCPNDQRTPVTSSWNRG